MSSVVSHAGYVNLNKCNHLKIGNVYACKKLVMEGCAFVLEEYVVHLNGYTLIQGKKHFKERELLMMIDLALLRVNYRKNAHI